MFQGMPEVEDLTTSYKHVGPIPDPFGPIADNHHDGVSAHPAQFPELGVQAPENLVSVSQASDQKSPHHRTAAWRGFHTLLRQQQDASLDLAKTPFFDNGQGRQPLLADAAAAMAAPLHSQHTAVHSQYHHRGRILYLRTRTAALGVIAAQLVTVDRGRLPQPLGDPPNTHGTDGDAQQQPGQPCRQGIRSDAGQQSQQSWPRSRSRALVPPPGHPARAGTRKGSLDNDSAERELAAVRTGPARRPNGHREAPSAAHSGDTKGWKNVSPPPRR